MELRIWLVKSFPGDAQVLVWGSTENPAGEVLWAGKAGKKLDLVPRRFSFGLISFSSGQA